MGKTDYWLKFVLWLWMPLTRTAFEAGAGRDWMRRYLNDLA